MRKTAEQVQAEQERATRIENDQLADIKKLLGLPEFRRYAKRYMSLCNVFKTTFTGNSESFFREGQRSIGTTMFGEIMQCAPERFAEVMSERLASEQDEPDDE